MSLFCFILLSDPLPNNQKYHTLDCFVQERRAIFSQANPGGVLRYLEDGAPIVSKEADPQALPTGGRPPSLFRRYTSFQTSKKGDPAQAFSFTNYVGLIKIVRSPQSHLRNSKPFPSIDILKEIHFGFSSIINPLPPQACCLP